MPGLYLHIPFCKQACHYCNFHFSTSLGQRAAMTAALLRELTVRQHELARATLTSIYFGGGTPSLLPDADLAQLFEHIYDVFAVASDAEITLEANPDDLTLPKLRALRDTPVNRLSIGVQSFAGADLQFMNRAHNADEAHQCIENALRVGFDNLSIDLIYGVPTSSDTQWHRNLQTLVDYGIPHLSCYALTVEPRTALAHFIKTGKVPNVDEEQTARQFEYLLQYLRANGYEQYEISNFARPGWQAQHNSSYWSGEAYLGIGPSAHSFDGQLTRRWNVANNAVYMDHWKNITNYNELQALENELFEQEILNTEQRYNEYVMTALRTNKGVRKAQLHTLGSAFATHFQARMAPFLAQGWLLVQDEAFVLSDAGKLLADFIASELFITNE